MLASHDMYVCNVRVKKETLLISRQLIRKINYTLSQITETNILTCNNTEDQAVAG